MSSSLLDADEIRASPQRVAPTAYRELQKMLHVVVGCRAIRVSETAFDADLRRRSSSPTSAATPGAPRMRSLGHDVAASLGEKVRVS